MFHNDDDNSTTDATGPRATQMGPLPDFLDNWLGVPTDGMSGVVPALSLSSILGGSPYRVMLDEVLPNETSRIREGMKKRPEGVTDAQWDALQRMAIGMLYDIEQATAVFEAGEAIMEIEAKKTRTCGKDVVADLKALGFETISAEAAQETFRPRIITLNSGVDSAALLRKLDELSKGH